MTEGHQTNVLKTSSRRPYIPATLTTTRGRNLQLTVRPGSAPSTRSSPPLRTPAEPILGRNTAGRISREPQQQYQTRPLTAFAAAGLGCPALAKPAISMPTVKVDSLLHKSSIAKSSQEEDIYIYIYIYR